MHDDSNPFGGRHNATELELLESVWKNSLFDCVFRQILSYEFQKSAVIVDLTPTL